MVDTEDYGGAIDPALTADTAAQVKAYQVDEHNQR